ncbi:hypothetical protein AAVH_07754 [Aphelenchoides avenae]|nr:hypothetical protein AAVH_07754 [Aphelenchus avenae]
MAEWSTRERCGARDERTARESGRVISSKEETGERSGGCVLATAAASFHLANSAGITRVWMADELSQATSSFEARVIGPSAFCESFVPTRAVRFTQFIAPSQP